MSRVFSEVLHPIPDSMLREYLDRPELDYKSELPGLELVEAGRINSSGRACDEHVFAGEAWYQNTSRLLLFESGTLNILADAGYRATIKPGVGDVAVYLSDWSGNGRFYPTHYGKVIDEKLVESKFGENGGVFRHHPYLVPKLYGEFILFLHK